MLPGRHHHTKVSYLIQSDQKVSVHLMIAIQYRQVHRDLLITLYN